MPAKTDSNGMTPEDRAAAHTFRSRGHLRANNKDFSARESADDDRARLQAANNKMLADARRSTSRDAK